MNGVKSWKLLKGSCKIICVSFPENTYTIVDGDNAWLLRLMSDSWNYFKTSALLMKMNNLNNW